MLNIMRKRKLDTAQLPIAISEDLSSNSTLTSTLTSSQMRSTQTVAGSSKVTEIFDKKTGILKSRTTKTKEKATVTIQSKKEALVKKMKISNPLLQGKYDYFHSILDSERGKNAMFEVFGNKEGSNDPCYLRDSDDSGDLCESDDSGDSCECESEYEDLDSSFIDDDDELPNKAIVSKKVALCFVPKQTKKEK